MYAIRVRVTEGDGGVDAAAAGIDDAIDDSFASLQNTQGDAAADNNGEALEDLPAQVPFTAGNPLVEHITGIVHLYRRVPTREEAEAAARAGGQAASSSSSASSSSAATATTAASSTAAAAALASLNEEADSDQLCILSLPDDLAVADLCAFLGRHLAKVRAVRLVRRAPAEAPVPAAAPAAVAAAAAAPSVSDATAADKEEGAAAAAEDKEGEDKAAEAASAAEGEQRPAPPPPPQPQLPLPLPLPMPMPRLALLRLDSPRAAAEARRDLDARPFSSLEPDVLCRIVPVRHVEVDEGGRSRARGATGAEGAEERGGDDGDGDGDDGKKKTTARAAPLPPPNRPPPPGTTELPPCPVCLERLDDHISGVVTTVCNHVFHADCLQRWAGASCPVCRYAGGGAAASSSSPAAFLGALSNLPGASAAAIAANAAALADASSSSSQSRCSTCSATHDLWICLICGHVSSIFFEACEKFSSSFFHSFSFFAQLKTKKLEKKNRLAAAATVPATPNATGATRPTATRSSWRRRGGSGTTPRTVREGEKDWFFLLFSFNISRRERRRPKKKTLTFFPLSFISLVFSFFLFL